MEQNTNVTDQNAGVTDPASQNAPATGTPGGDTGANNGTPDNQNKPQTDPRDEKIETLSNNVKALNKALIDAKRKGRQGNQLPGNNQENPFDSEAGVYAASLELSDARLRGNLEERIALYPELPADELQRIRLNPWAFASRQSFLSGDFETALDEIEEKIADRVEKLTTNSSEQSGGQQPAGATAPATVNANPTPEVTPEEAEPGSVEDEDLWTMPMAKLEKLKNKAVQKMSQKQQ